MTHKERTSATKFRAACLAAMAVCLLGSCASSEQVVADRLDPVTGVTIKRATVPLVLYRPNSAVAAHARDFVYVGPILVNRMGENHYFLWFGVWSTLQDQNVSSQRDGFESIVVYADGELFNLELSGWTNSAIGVSESVYPSPTASAANAYYSVTLDQLRLIARATDIELRTGGPRTARYSQWDSQAQAKLSLHSFLRGLSY